MLTITASSTDEDLTTTGALRALVLGATTTSTAQDAQLSLAIQRASRWVENYIGEPLSVQTYQEMVPSYDRRALLLARTPVRAVKRLYDSSDTGTAVQILTTEFRVEREAGRLTRDLGWYWSVPIDGDLEGRPRSGQEYEPWLADYVAGYSYGGVDTGSANWSTAAGTTSTGRTLPEDIEQAVLEKARGLFNGADEAQSERLGDLEVNYRSLGVDENGRLVTQAIVLLEPYRRVV